MEKNEQMIIVYNMGNFHNGKTAQTHDKAAKETYEKAGYKLISTVFMTITKYLAGR